MQSLLFTPEGKPRCAVVYLAHLSEEERQFVVTLVFAKLVTWMRGQSGTPDLRALAYMDEVFGYMPPTAEPPSKKPMLTVFKQGRAFGVGLVLSTQNPVDLDYKAMSNASHLARRPAADRERQGARARGPALGRRRHRRRRARRGDRRAPEAAVPRSSRRRRRSRACFGTRWAMSYLRGPLTKEEVCNADGGPQGAGQIAAQPATGDARAASLTLPHRPRSRPTRRRSRRRSRRGYRSGYLSPSAPWGSEVGAVAGSPRQRAYLAARVSLRYDDTAAGIDEQQEFEAVYGPLDGGLDLDSERQVDYDDRDFRRRAARRAPCTSSRARRSPRRSSSPGAAKDIQRRLVEKRALELQRNPALKLVSRPGESPDDFAARCHAAAQEQGRRGDGEDPRAARGEARPARQGARRGPTPRRGARYRRALAPGERARGGCRRGARRPLRRTTQHPKSITSAISGATSRRGHDARGSGERRASAEEKVEDTQDDLAALEQEILDEVAEIDEKWTAIAEKLDTVSIRLEATDVRVVETRLLWVPSA